MSGENRPARIVSMDQFRGYTVAGMLLVNYVSGMEAFHAVLKHHGVYFSYADSIMPSFFFAVGYSFRLTILRRLPQLGTTRTCWTYFRRSLSLILISLMFYGFGAGDEFRDWANYSWQSAWHLVTRVIKADLWETLALIGVTQIFLLPFIGRSLKFRSWTIVCFLILHAVLSYLFNFNFAHQQPNALEEVLIRTIDWGAITVRCWESGPFGVLNWGVAMLMGSVAYDIVQGNSGGKSAVKLLSLGILLMAVGYSISCLTRLYDVDKGEGPAVSTAVETAAENESTGSAESDADNADDAASEAELVEASDAESDSDEKEEEKEEKDPRADFVNVPWAAPPKNLEKFAASPVWPPLDRISGQEPESLLAEPPFVAPPDQSVRRINYWMMTKQLPSPSFILFASGFACALYGLFVVACDIGPIRIGLFRTFGQNPLAAYLLHTVVAHALHTISPDNAPFSFCLASVAVFFLICYGLVRGLEKQGIYIRL